MEKHYLDLDFKTMTFYEYSNSPKDGFEEHKTSTGTVSYRKFYSKGVYGLLQSISVVKKKNGMMIMSIRVLNNQDIYLMSIPLYDQKGNFDNRIIEPLITLLPNMKKEGAYRFFPWAMESSTSKRKDGKPRMMYGMSVKHANLDTETVIEGDEGKVKPKFFRKKKDEQFNAQVHLPELDFVEEYGAYKPTAVSVDERKAFLKTILDEALVELGYDKSENNSQTQTQTQSAPAKTEVEPEKVNSAPSASMPEMGVEEDYDDLPF